ncbi:MAG: LysR family transcriptional regulator [Hoeflea sp.]|uniref:LysR family transcriptional regulator n=1 Tax=Hoeflea sp. TaxID=1940281 RepID=UPI0032EFB9D5
MNDKETSWEDLHLFLAVARSGGLSPAARITGRSAATLGRRMLALERAMGRELFVRHERGYELTAEARDLERELGEIENRIARINRPDGRSALPLVKISAGTWTTLILLDRLEEIAGDPGDVRLRFVSAEATLDIPRREVVIGVRNRRPEDPSLAGRKLAKVEFAAFARPDAPDRWIKVVAETPSARWLDRRIGADAVCEVASPRNALDLALAGRGVALLPTFVGSRNADLVQRGGTIGELAHEQWLVTHQDDRHLPEVRRTIDRLVRVFDRRL